MNARRFALAALILVAATQAAAQTENVWTRNNTDRWAWATAIGYVKKVIGGRYENIAAWCIAPRSYDKYNKFPTQVQSIRYELTDKNCAHPVAYDGTMNNLPRSTAAEVTITQSTCYDISRRPFPCYKIETPIVMDNRPKPSICPFSCQSVLPGTWRCIGPGMNSCGAVPKQFLRTGESITETQTLRSPNRLYFAMLQLDGNLCVYKNSPDPAPGNPLWCSHRGGRGAKFMLTMQGDGNLCEYPASSPGRNPTWCTMKVAQGGQFFAAQQDDGNLCVYPGTSPSDQKGPAIWCHNTNVGR